MREADQRPQMSENIAPRSRLKRNSLLLIVPALFSAAIVFFVWQAQPDIQYWKALSSEIYGFLEANPGALVLALAILPGIGFPISPLFIMIGAVLGPKYGLPMTCLIAIAAQSTCTIWTYLLAAGPLKKFLGNYVLKKRQLPEFSDNNALRFALIMRITPGIPYAVQNVVLGVIGLKLKPYLIVSIPITALWTIGFVTTGGALFKGSAGLAITGVLILIILIMATRILRNRTADHAG
ncbi:MAG: TVP38/TMEM64 family protein [Opitutaceae bacterium]